MRILNPFQLTNNIQFSIPDSVKQNKTVITLVALTALASLTLIALICRRFYIKATVQNDVVKPQSTLEPVVCIGLDHPGFESLQGQDALKSAPEPFFEPTSEPFFEAEKELDCEPTQDVMTQDPVEDELKAPLNPTPMQEQTPEKGPDTEFLYVSDELKADPKVVSVTIENAGGPLQLNADAEPKIDGQVVLEPPAAQPEAQHTLISTQPITPKVDPKPASKAVSEQPAKKTEKKDEIVKAAEAQYKKHPIHKENADKIAKRISEKLDEGILDDPTASLEKWKSTMGCDPTDCSDPIEKQAFIFFANKFNFDY